MIASRRDLRVILPQRDLRVILIGGSSHAGKSILAQALAQKLGWRAASTDGLARHPGRPWKKKPERVPNHVAEHHLSLSVDELITDVLRHYRSMWPDIESMVTSHATDLATYRLVLEGSALWPETVATLDLDSVASIWLTASDEVFRSRIYGASGFGEASARERQMIQKFLDRTLLYNARMREIVSRRGLACVDVGDASSVEELGEKCLALINC